MSTILKDHQTSKTTVYTKDKVPMKLKSQLESAYYRKMRTSKMMPLHSLEIRTDITTTKTRMLFLKGVGKGGTQNKMS